jgi:D-alanyl-D-alanine carboxypeptidase/D-alanyl-D-alanine-endopeptidase (penicillin-binding protein 4)
MPYVKNSANSKNKSKRSRGRKRLTGAALLAVIVLVLALVLRPRSHAAAILPERHPVPAYAAAAARRTAAQKWGAAAADDLRAAVRSALAAGTSGAGDWSCIVIAQDGAVLYDDRAAHAVAPASTQKLIVSDPAYRFDTLLAATQPAQDGKLQGDLYLAGSGDPSLRSDELRSGVAQLRKAGVDAIDGRVVVDPSALAGEEINPLWNADDANEDFMTATSGISIDGDTAEFHVIGTSAGAPAQVTVTPQNRDIHMYGSVTTGGGDDVIIAATETPNEFRLAGNIPPGVEEKYWLPVHGIAQYTGAVMDALLKSQGIALAHTAATGTVPVDAQILWNHRSRPLPDLIKHMLIFSDNHFAEQLMRVLGGRNGGIATDASGLAEERHILAAEGIPEPGLHIVDGSGLAHANRVAAVTLARILAHYDAAPGGNVLYPLLPRGGRDGTLRMYHFDAAAGRVRAKSGHLDNAAALAGYVDTRKHGRVVFAFLINGSPGDPDAAIVSAVDRIAER